MTLPLSPAFPIPVPVPPFVRQLAANALVIGGLDRRQERPAKKINMHVVIALRHLNKRRGVLLEKRAAIIKEIEELDQAILALE